MTKRETIFFAVFVNLIIILGLLPFLTADVGLTSHRMQAYTVDENDTVYLLANQKIRIASSDGQVIAFRSPLKRAKAIDTDEQFIHLFSDNEYMVINTSGKIIEQGSIDEKVEKNKKDPIRRGDSVYQYRSFLGFYKITKETNGTTVVRYQMPASDVVVRALHFIGIISFVAFCIGFPLYFITHKRFAKDGTILPKRS